MILDIPSQPRKLNNLLIPEARSVPTLRRNFSFHRKPGLMIRNMLNHLRDNLLVNNLKRPLVDNEPVRTDNPATSASPRPQLDSMMIFDGSPLTGSRVNMTPETSDSNIFLTPTLMITFSCGNPFSSR